MDQNRDEKVRAVKREILDEIESVSKCLEKPKKSYVCYEDLRSIWSVWRIRKLLGADCDFRVIQKDMILILSTLISVDATECLANFRSRLFDPSSGEPLLVDSEIPFEKDQLRFLDSEPAVREKFYDYQFRFKPVVIEITRGQKTQVIDQRLRLPFEYREKNVGAGGYGEVDRVGISPTYIKRDSGWISADVYVVACKKIRLPKDFVKEVDNLQILRESLTRHHRIMLHLATMAHGPNHYILLPYAQYGDLELFLHCGIGPDRKEKYDFDKRFNEVRNGDVTHHLLSQCWSLANALKWLHNGIQIEKTSSTVFCAHMDLKPANILIQPDPDSEPNSIVGKWMISDFGISVLKEEAKPHDSEFVSIGDYYSHLAMRRHQTMNTLPTRREGTYQAPEVRLPGNAAYRSSSSARDVQGIGRKSDIWSYGCIFSEVLAFALDQDKLVKAFRSQRKGHGNDYFYEAEQTHLGPSENTAERYHVRPSVLTWLDSICEHYASPKRWVECYVGSIKKILIVDAEKRPDATQLEGLVEHVKEHEVTSRDSSDDHCPILDGPDSSPPSPVPMSPAPPVKPPHAHRIIIGATPKTSIRSLLGRNGSKLKANYVALTCSNNEVRAAYLVKSSVYFYKMNVEESSDTFGQQKSNDTEPRRSDDPGPHKPQYFELEVELAQCNGWQGIAVAGDFLAAWGFSSKKLLHLRDIRQPQDAVMHNSLSGIEMLERVTVSKNGVAALMCGQKVKIVTIRQVYLTKSREHSLIPSSNQTLVQTLSAQPGQNFTDAAFNDTGNLLFAWAYGQTDSLYAWRWKDRAMNGKTESECHYVTRKMGKPYLARVIPYNTYQGCIIATPDERFFPAQIRGSQRGTSDTISTLRTLSRNHEVKIANVLAACMFLDNSMITVEKEMFRRARLKEYEIEYKRTHLLRSPGVEVCKLESSPDQSSRLLVVENEEDITVIVCNLNGMIEFAKIVKGPENTQLI